MAPARLASVCTTIFGRPVVPDVRRIHSVGCRGVRSHPPGVIFGLQVTSASTPGAAAPGAAASVTCASTAAVATTYGRCSAGGSGGQRTRRDATPSSSISARAAVSWSLVATRTERSRSSCSRPSRAEPSTRSPSETLASAPHSALSERRPTPLDELQSEIRSGGGILVEPDEVAHGHRKLRVLVGIERIDAQRVLEPGDDDGQAERVETRVEKHEIVGQRRERLLLFPGDLFELSDDAAFHGHGPDLRPMGCGLQAAAAAGSATVASSATCGDVTRFG